MQTSQSYIFSSYQKFICPRCEFLLNSTVHVPIVAPCGHTFCNICIEEEFLEKMNELNEEYKDTSFVKEIDMAKMISSPYSNEENETLSTKDSITLTNYYTKTETYSNGQMSILESYNKDGTTLGKMNIFSEEGNHPSNQKTL